MFPRLRAPRQGRVQLQLQPVAQRTDDQSDTPFLQQCPKDDQRGSRCSPGKPRADSLSRKNLSHERAMQAVGNVMLQP